jgi:hypothetical protein
VLTNLQTPSWIWWIVFLSLWHWNFLICLKPDQLVFLSFFYNYWTWAALHRNIMRFSNIINQIYDILTKLSLCDHVKLAPNKLSWFPSSSVKEDLSGHGTHCRTWRDVCRQDTFMKVSSAVIPECKTYLSKFFCKSILIFHWCNIKRLATDGWKRTIWVIFNTCNFEALVDHIDVIKKIHTISEIFITSQKEHFKTRDRLDIWYWGRWCTLVAI